MRKRSAALINDDLLIDLGPDIITASNIHGHPLSNVRYCLQTHAHADHLDVSHLLSRSPDFGVVGAQRLHLYASSATWRRAAQTFARDLSTDYLLDREVGEKLNLEIHQIGAMETFAVGHYQVTTFPANHDPSVEPLLYAIRGDGRNLFYGADTATLTEETWRAFHQHKMRFDVVILDHTYGPDEIGSDHLSARQFIDHAARMRQEGLLTANARILATHIAHEGNPPHPELAEFAAEHGYEVAYDGLTV